MFMSDIRSGWRLVASNKKTNPYPTRLVNTSIWLYEFTALTYNHIICLFVLLMLEWILQLLMFGGHGTGGWLSRYDIYYNDCVVLDRGENFQSACLVWWQAYAFLYRSCFWNHEILSFYCWSVPFKVNLLKFSGIIAH